MTETIENGCDGFEKWHWFNVQKDLIEQGGLTGVVEINPLSVKAHGCGGEHNGNHFYFTWLYSQFLLVTMQQFSQPLIDAFAKVVGYQPFCHYKSGGLVTVEWDKDNPELRLEELKQEQGEKFIYTLTRRNDG